jgi:large subunit ribosomal protein L6
MSRIGKQKINIPAGVTVKIDNDKIIASGKLGHLESPYFKDSVEVVIGSDIEVKSLGKADSPKLWGLQRTLIANIVQGITEKFEKRLEVNGVGFRVDKKGKGLSLKLGYSHLIDFEAPEGIELNVEKNVIIVSGIDKVQVGDTAARLRALRKPDVYKGKGVRYLGEEIKLKQISTGGKK